MDTRQETFFVRGPTGLIYDDQMIQHRNLWQLHPECPERYMRIMERFRELDLVSRCKVLSPRKATVDEILKKHSEEHYDLLKSTHNYRDQQFIEDLCSKINAVYIHPKTFEISCLSAGCAIELVNNILWNRIQNGMAIIRPPGHHCGKSEFNGFCILNNVALATQSALDQGIKRILIVDWDVHHGQGIQSLFYDDPRVLYFSIHRYDFGSHWPNLRESNYDYIGTGNGKGFNFNVTLNEAGLKNGDYLAIFQQILLPVAEEYQPELIIIAAGYDAAYGCPLGEMEVTPACYSHFLSPLMSLAQGKVAVILEGGYCLDSLAEGAAHTLKTLLGDPCPLLIDPILPPSNSVQDSIFNCIWTHRPYWKCLQINETYHSNSNAEQTLEKHEVNKLFIETHIYELDKDGCPRYDTRFLYPTQTQEDVVTKEKADFLARLKELTNLNVPANRLCYSVDEFTEVENFLETLGLHRKIQRISSRLAKSNELQLFHSVEYVESLMFSTDTKNKHLFASGAKSVGCILQILHSILNGTSRSGIYFDKENDSRMFNSTGIATQYALKHFGLERILVINWNSADSIAVQEYFQSTSKVLCINMNFVNKETESRLSFVGEGDGEGYSLNIPLTQNTKNIDLIAIIQRLLMPIAYEFNPQLIIMSGMLKHSNNISIEFYGHFIHWLSAFANGRIILCCNDTDCSNVISFETLSCIKVLLGDPRPYLISDKEFDNETIDTINKTSLVYQNYWKCLKFNRLLPDFGYEN